MKLYIAYKHDNTVLSVILAQDMDTARIFWLGADLNQHHIEEIDPNAEELKTHNVVRLLHGVEKDVSRWDPSKPRNVLLLKRGGG